MVNASVMPRGAAVVNDPFFGPGTYLGNRLRSFARDLGMMFCELEGDVSLQIWQGSKVAGALAVDGRTEYRFTIHIPAGSGEVKYEIESIPDDQKTTLMKVVVDG